MLVTGLPVRLHGSIAIGQCSREHAVQPIEHRRRQHLIEVFGGEPAYAGIRGANTPDRCLERLAPDDSREQEEDVFAKTRAILRRNARAGLFLDVGSIEKTISPPALGWH